MLTIAAPLDFEEGHTFPLFGLLKLLKARGHRVCCLGTPKVQDLVRRENIEFIPLRVPQEALSNKAVRVPEGNGKGFWWYLLHGILDEIITQLNPDLALVRSLYRTEALVMHYRYRLPIVFYSSSFRIVSKVEECEFRVIDSLIQSTGGVPELLDLLTKSGARFGSFKEIAHLLIGFPELLLFPEAFDLSERVAEPGVYYVGAGVDLTRSEESFDWNNIDPERTLIYCALGSQSDQNAEKSYRIVRIVLDVAMERPEWQFIIAIGKRLDPRELAPSPANVIITPWAPQLEVLRRADVMINHGGFNTIKECIMMGVPMLVFPLLQERDHVPIAERVVYHGLGLRLDIEQVSSTELGSLIEHVTKNQTFKERLGFMREKFEQQDRPEIGIQVIEDILSSSATSVLHN
jgi:MGT family glycosyltransferase